MTFTRGGDSGQRDATQEASEEEELERTSSACSHAGGVKVAARNLLAEPRSAGNEQTWNTLMAKFPCEDDAAESAAAAEAVLASATEGEDGNAPPWLPDDEYASEVLFGVIDSRSALSGPENDGQRFAPPQSIIHTDIGQKEFGRGMTVFWRKIVDEPDACSTGSDSSSCSRASTHWGKVPTGLRGHDVDEAHHRRGYTTVVAEVGRGQPRGEAVSGRRTRWSGACKSENENAARDGQLARSPRLLQRLQHG